MIQCVFANDLPADSQLGQSMFRDRASQFCDRLKWDLQVDSNGEERDQYDALNPLYVIWEREDGLHGGSMRFLPTLGRCMFNEHFRHLTKGKNFRSPKIWECTRFCLAPDTSGCVAAALMLAGGQLMQVLDIDKILGVFDSRMVRIYSRIGASPRVIGSVGQGWNRISVGLWAYSESAMQSVSTIAGIPASRSRRWIESSPLGQSQHKPMAA
jgi:acyl homoserine lactone synthase